MKIGIDIGGVLSRYPNEMKTLTHALICTGHRVYLLTDMSEADAQAAMLANDLPACFYELVCCDWSKDGDLCKARRCQEFGIDIMIDDRLDYLIEGAPIALLVVPRPQTSYYHHNWQQIPPTPTAEEYQAFLEWRRTQKTKKGSSGD